LMELEVSTSFHICPFHSHSHVVSRHHLRIANTAAN
jgi:hypothetical protein